MDNKARLYNPKQSSHWVLLCIINLEVTNKMQNTQCPKPTTLNIVNTYVRLTARSKLENF